MEPSLERHFRLHGAAFRDARGEVWRERLGPAFDEALELLLLVLSHDLATHPRELDREHLDALLSSLLPSRLTGDEPYARDLPDLLEDLLQLIAVEEGLASAWEWTHAIDGLRPRFLEALADPDRPLLAPIPRRPDRRPAPKIGRNDPCPCGSGRKYKQCCLRNV